MDDVYLKPCPRCGGKAVSDEAVSFSADWGKGIHCDDCGFWTGDEMSLEKAIAWWNEQPLIDNLCARITELEEKLAEQTKAAAGMFGASAYWEHQTKALEAKLAALQAQPVYEPIDDPETQFEVGFYIAYHGRVPDNYILCRLVQQVQP